MKNCKSAADTPLAASMKIMKDGAEKIIPTTYRISVGCLLHITAARPFKLFATSVLSRCMSSLSVLHFKFGKIILSYLKGVNLGMFYRKSHDNRL